MNAEVGQPEDPCDFVGEVTKGTKKRRVMTQELIGKFRSKSDFIKYFSENRKCPQY